MRRSLPTLAKIAPAAFYNALAAKQHDAFFGVPDSLLKDFCAYVTDNAAPGKHVITANEGNAVAMAAGYHVATGKVPVVYMQNSGFGNTVNPLLSLTHEQVYKMPMLVVVGWRGEPGKKDEPQHVAQGRLMEKCLESCEVPFSVLGAADDAEAQMAAALAKADAHFAEHGTPYGLLIRKDTFDKYKLQASDDAAAEPPLSREQAIEQVLTLLGEKDVVVSTTGMPSREVFECRARAKAGHHRDFLTVGSMGHASSIAAGVALGRQDAKDDRNVVVVDGDGGSLMHLGAVAVNGGVAKSTAGGAALLKNLKHIVVNNAAHDSVGGQPTVGGLVSLTGVAKACGYKTVHQDAVTSLGAISTTVRELLAMEGPAFLEIAVKKGNRPDLGRPTTTPIANKEAMMKFLQE